MSTFIIVVVLIVIAVFAFRGSRAHLKGEGGCCGGGGDVVPEDIKKLSGPVVARKVIHIEGMHCDNCKNSVQRQLNKLEGVSGEVDLKKKSALVSMDREVEEADLRIAVERLGYRVTGIEDA